MSGAFYRVLDGGLQKPTNFLESSTVTDIIVVDALELVLGAFRPIGYERFGRLVHVGFIGDLPKKLW